MKTEFGRPTRGVTEALSVRSRAYRKALSNEVAVAELSNSAPNEWGLGLALEQMPLTALKVPSRNVRKQDKKHIAEIMRSVRELGFVRPLLVTEGGNIIDGVCTYFAAEALGMKKVPCVSVSGLSEENVRLVRIALNRLGEKSAWDLDQLKIEFDDLLKKGGAVEVTGFSLPEIDQIIVDAKPTLDAKANRCPEVQDGKPVSRLGDIWILGSHRVLCGDATLPESYSSLFGNEHASMMFSDPPYNVKIDGFVSGAGKIKHREFVAAAGEMSDEEFVVFLTKYLKASAAMLPDGAVCFVCMDWRHSTHVFKAADNAGLTVINQVCWSKGNGGMGSLYRSAHELVFVIKKGATAHINNVELGKHGRDRCNVWVYPGANRIGSSANKELENHPTPKPVELVSDAILDVSVRGQIVLDPFLGSGTTIIAAEKVGRAAYGMELDPLYVDRIVRRYQEFTGKKAILAGTDLTFDEVQTARTAEALPAPKNTSEASMDTSAGTKTAPETVK